MFALKILLTSPLSSLSHNGALQISKSWPGGKMQSKYIICIHGCSLALFKPWDDAVQMRVQEGEGVRMHSCVRVCLMVCVCVFVFVCVCVWARAINMARASSVCVCVHSWYMQILAADRLHWNEPLLRSCMYGGYKPKEISLSLSLCRW